MLALAGLRTMEIGRRRNSEDFGWRIHIFRIARRRLIRRKIHLPALADAFQFSNERNPH